MRRVLGWIWKYGGTVFWTGLVLFFIGLFIAAAIESYYVSWVNEVTTSVGDHIIVKISTTNGRPANGNRNIFAGRSSDGKAIIQAGYGHSMTTVYYPVGSQVVLGPYPGARYRIESVTDMHIRVVRK